MKQPIRGDDPYVQAWVGWAIELLGPENWAPRRKALEHFNQDLMIKPLSASSLPTEDEPPADLSGWFLFQMQLWLDDNAATHIPTTNHLLPMVARVGHGIHLLKQVPGAESRLKVALATGSKQLLPCLYELAVALSYLELGCDVQCIAESPAAPTPDLLVRMNHRKLLVECKRKSVPRYARLERQHWKRLYSPVRSVLTQRRLGLFLDVVFHVPLESLGDDYLINLLGRHLRPNAIGEVIEAPAATISISQPDYLNLRRLLLFNYTRYGGNPFLYHLFHYNDLWRGITFDADFSSHPDIPNYVESLKWACAAIWSCDAESSIQLKANHFRRELANAVRQLPPHQPAAIHIGIESLADETVELHRVVRNHYEAFGNL